MAQILGLQCGGTRGTTGPLREGTLFENCCSGIECLPKMHKALSSSPSFGDGGKGVRKREKEKKEKDSEVIGATSLRRN